MSSDQIEALAGDEAYIYKSNLFHNYLPMVRAIGPLLDRSYEAPLKEYYLVFKPLNKNYDPKLYSKLYDHVRKKIGKVDTLFITMEIMETKIHYNVYCTTNRDLVPILHEKHTNRFFIYCECIDPERGLQKRNVLHYMIKESKWRIFKKDIDFWIKL